MLELTVAKNVLNRILFEHQDFKIALKSEISSKKRANKSDLNGVVSHLIIAELRHHILFKMIVERLGEKYTTDDLSYIYLLFTCKFFVKDFDFEKVNTDVKAFLKKDKYLPLTKVLENDDPFAFLNLNQKSKKYIACKYNIPPWIIDLWSDQYGQNFTVKIAHALSQPKELTYRVNSLYENVEDILKVNSDIFSETEVQDLYLAKQKDLQKAQMPKDFIFVEDINLKKIADKYTNDFLNEVTIYSGSDDILPLEFLIRSKLEMGINIPCPFIEEKATLMRVAREFNARNMNAFLAHDLIKMKTGISRPTEVVYCNPKSSSFGKINSKPDYLVHLRMSELQKMVKMQKEAIENCAQFVCNDGVLIYIVDTINKNETINVVANFISKHPEFSIIEEEQLYPQSANGSTLYYAVLKLEKNDD